MSPRLDGTGPALTDFEFLGGAEHIGPDEHGYETQYLLSSSDGSIDVPALRAGRACAGNSDALFRPNSSIPVNLFRRHRN